MARQGHGFLTVDEVRVIKRVEDEKSSVSSSDKENGDRELIDVARDGKEIGEIIMRGNSAMLEYYKDNEATAKTIKNGWLHTGDLAVRYPGGEVFIADRAKDIIISGGENISSLMVENEMADHEDVFESCVVARSHERWGEVGHAFVVLKAGKQKDIEKLRAHCRTRMSKVRPIRQVGIEEKLTSLLLDYSLLCLCTLILSTSCQRRRRARYRRSELARKETTVASLVTHSLSLLQHSSISCGQIVDGLGN
jgi:acyl-CoA synthetase (AMP-forming)/AMP-acid ligase II